MNSRILSSQCEKHGNVLDMTLSMTHIENGVYKTRHYCLLCLADIFDALQKSFEVPKLSVVEKIDKEILKESQELI
jgi:hypothetical protein